MCFRAFPYRPWRKRCAVSSNGPGLFFRRRSGKKPQKRRRNFSLLPEPELLFKKLWRFMPPGKTCRIGSSLSGMTAISAAAFLYLFTATFSIFWKLRKKRFFPGRRRGPQFLPCGELLFIGLSGRSAFPRTRSGELPFACPSIAAFSEPPEFPGRIGMYSAT